MDAHNGARLGWCWWWRSAFVHERNAPSLAVHDSQGPKEDGNAPCPGHHIGYVHVRRPSRSCAASEICPPRRRRRRRDGRMSLAVTVCSPSSISCRRPRRLGSFRRKRWLCWPSFASGSGRIIRVPRGEAIHHFLLRDATEASFRMLVIDRSSSAPPRTRCAAPRRQLDIKGLAVLVGSWSFVIVCRRCCCCCRRRRRRPPRLWQVDSTRLSCRKRVRRSSRRFVSFSRSSLMRRTGSSSTLWRRYSNVDPNPVGNSRGHGHPAHQRPPTLKSNERWRVGSVGSGWSVTPVPISDRNWRHAAGKFYFSVKIKS
jgi:hypothetical protein